MKYVLLDPYNMIGRMFGVQRLDHLRGYPLYPDEYIPIGFHAQRLIVTVVSLLQPGIQFRTLE